jgi:hypothetical protein
MKPLRLVAEIDVAGAQKELSALVKAIESGNSRMSSSMAGLHGAFMASQSAEAKAYQAVATEAEKASKRKATAEAQQTASTVSESRKRSEAQMTEMDKVVTQLNKRDALLLQLDKQTGMARANAENNLFDRQLERLRAQGTYLLRIHKGNAEAEVRIKQWVEQQYTSIEARRAKFSDTPFQQHIAAQNRLGLAVKNSSYQFADFAVQVSGGQNAILAFSQQSTQLLQGFGMWGAVIGAGTAILGALYIGLSKSKEGVDGLNNALKSARFDIYTQQLDDLSQAFREYSKEVNDSTNSDEASLLVLGMKAKAFTQAKEAVDQNTQSLILLFGSLENAQGAYRRLQSQTVGGLRIEAEISGLNSDNLGDAVKIQELRNKEKMQSVQRGFDQERLAVAGWERAKAEDGKTFLETEKQLKDRQAKEIARINKDENESEALSRLIGNNEVLRIQREFGEKDAKEAKRQADERARILESAHKREQDEARRFYDSQAAMQRDLSGRLAEAQGQDALARLDAKQAAETIEAQRFANSNVLTQEQWRQHQETLSLLEKTQVQERINLAISEREKKTKLIQDNNAKIASSFLGIGGVIAETWKIGPLQRALMWLQRIQTVLTAIAAIRTAVTALGGASALISGPAGIGAAVAGAVVAKSGAGSDSAPLTIGAQGLVSGGLSKNSGRVQNINVGGITISMPAGTTSAQASQLGKIAADSLLNRLRANPSAVREAEYAGVTG